MTETTKKTNCRPFCDYAEYVSGLKRLAQQPYRTDDWNPRTVAALNGQASIELRNVASVETRRKFGAFFTGNELSSQLIGHGKAFNAANIFYDPSCGMGDLLLAVARMLPLSRSLSDTLTQWGKQLSGSDLHREFVEGARTRLVLLARQRHKSDEPLRKSYTSFFPNIRVADGLRQRAMFERATNLLLNPPFGLVHAPAYCEWAGGRITEAATFVVTALEKSKPGVEMLAILPDVLRAGSFTEHWRNRVSELAEVRLVKPYGIFDESADVDVFLLRLVRRGSAKRRDAYRWPAAAARQSRITVADFFEVHVGRVVPHRDKLSGPRHPYIHPRCVPTWTVMREFPETRKHEGLVYQTPFVAIRRTSRPGHPFRATATVIGGKRSVAVENHLIVCVPKDRKLSTCKELMRQLKSERVNKHLNARIRCRHLTVDSVSGIPVLPFPQ